MQCQALFEITDQRTKYCSNACVGLYRKRFGQNYLKVTGGRREHQVIAERALGRPLPTGAVVHHGNSRRRDNRNGNLVICQAQAYHQLLHARQRVIDAGGDPNTQKICSLCKALRSLNNFSQTTSHGRIVPGHRCKSCVAAQQRLRRAVKREVSPCWR